MSEIVRNETTMPAIYVYLAARYSRREELLGYAERLREFGFECRSRWLNGNHQIDDQGLSVEAKREERERFAREDYADVGNSSVVISFTEEPRSANSRGGRHVEFGVGYALHKRMIVVGPRENVFHCLPDVEHYETFELMIRQFEAWRKQCRERGSFESWSPLPPLTPPNSLVRCPLNR